MSHGLEYESAGCSLDEVAESGLAVLVDQLREESIPRQTVLVCQAHRAPPLGRDAENSPGFNYETYWPKIAQWPRLILRDSTATAELGSLTTIIESRPWRRHVPAVQSFPLDG